MNSFLKCDDAIGKQHMCHMSEADWFFPADFGIMTRSSHIGTRRLLSVPVFVTFESV